MALPYATEQQVLRIVEQKIKESGGGDTPAPSKDEIIAIVNKAIEDGEIVIDEPDKRDSWRVAIRVNIDENNYYNIEAYTDFFDTEEIVFDAISNFLETPITNSEEFNAAVQAAGPMYGLRLMIFLGTINSYNTIQRYLSIFDEDMAEPMVYNVLCSGYFGKGMISGDYNGLVDLQSILESFAEKAVSVEGYVQRNGEAF